MCILLLIQKHNKLYGLDLLDKLKEIDLEIKEGTLYPLLNRMTEDQILKSIWDTENVKGHPRKFYSLTKDGIKMLGEMKLEYSRLYKIYVNLNK